MSGLDVAIRNWLSDQVRECADCEERSIICQQVTDLSSQDTQPYSLALCGWTFIENTISTLKWELRMQMDSLNLNEWSNVHTLFTHDQEMTFFFISYDGGVFLIKTATSTLVLSATHISQLCFPFIHGFEFFFFYLLVLHLKSTTWFIKKA